MVFEPIYVIHYFDIPINKNVLHHKAIIGEFFIIFALMYKMQSLKQIWLLSFTISLILFSQNYTGQTVVTSTWLSGSNLISTPASYGVKGVSCSSCYPGMRRQYSNWMDSKGHYWIFGGTVDSVRLVMRNDLWMYDTANREWTWIAGSNLPNQKGTYSNKFVGDTANTPGCREFASTWVDDSDNLWLFGGVDTYTKQFGDLWKFDTNKKNWIWMGGDTAYNNVIAVHGTKGVSSKSNSPGARYSCFFFNDKNNNFWLYGGEYNGGHYSDLWRYTHSDSCWTWISGSNLRDVLSKYGQYGIPSATNDPGARWGGIGMCDDSNQIWIFGGGRKIPYSIQASNDLWMFNLKTNKWTWIKGDTLNNSGNYGTKGVGSSVNTPGWRGGEASWKDPEGNLWIFGGGGLPGVDYVNCDLWKFDFSQRFWTWVSGTNGAFFNGVYGTKNIGDTLNYPGSRSAMKTVAGRPDGLYIYMAANLLVMDILVNFMMTYGK